METQTISSRNIVDLIFRDRFNTDICGSKAEFITSHTPESAQSVLKEEKVETNEKPDDFVLGWDC